jgi:hypothetical protein
MVGSNASPRVAAWDCDSSSFSNAALVLGLKGGSLRPLAKRCSVKIVPFFILALTSTRNFVTRGGRPKGEGFGFFETSL